ncbi:plasmid replication protein, CyRepA1 family [Dapis sp. BLCC M126]|uniref:plasmid replication protein, CyRepA1 family n=1 Tax=Dapis sp. BLCC M126 TaxID=3400189 RepID=UPI003CEBAEDB
MSEKWTKFSKLTENCPICGGKHKRCRTNGSLVICGEDWQIPGWKNHGQDKAGVGYLYRPDSSQSSEYRLPKPEPAKPSKVSHLTQGKINNLLLDMLCQQPVEDWARADLLKRGVEPSGLLGKSFPRGVIDDKYDGLPGTYRDSQGRLRTVAPSNSYFCPIFNENGLIVGGQLKVKDGKYIWLSAGNKGGYTQHINGKTPHTLCDSNQDKRVQFFVNEGKGSKQRKNIVLFSEGCLKPYIINQLSGYPCIGAVGGNFKGNFEQIDKFIGKVTNNNPDQFTFAVAADAGSGINDLVLSQYKALARCIKEKYDKRLHVTWYGQYTKKEHLDFDDILATGKANYQLIPFDRLIRKNKEFRKVQEKKRFTAKHKFSSRYIPVNDHFWDRGHNPIFNFTENVNQGKRNVLALKSPMGTGKTEALKKMLELLNCGIFLIGYRNSLLLQTGERIPRIYHQTEIVNRGQFAAKTESIALCIDSCWKISVEDVQGKVIVLDEAPLVLEHLLTSDTCKSRRYELISHLEVLLANCAGVVVMSDQLTDKEVELVQKASNIGDDNTLTVENTYQMPSRKVTMYDCERHLRQAINDAVTKGEKIFLPSDSQKFTEAWGRKTIEDIKSDCRVLIINSETLYQKEVQDFLKSPNEHLHLYDFVLTSPTAESGLSINDKYFDAIYVRWTHLGLDACTQIMHRVRETDCPVHLFAYSARNASKTERDLQKDKRSRIFEMAEQSYKLGNHYLDDKDFRRAAMQALAYAIEDEQQSLFSAYLDDIKEVKLLEQHSFRDLLSHELRARGYEVVEPEAIEINDDKIKTWNQSETIKTEKSQAIFDAKDLDEQEYEKLNRRETRTPEQMAELGKYRLKSQFPGIEESTEWGVDFIKAVTFDSPGLKRTTWVRYLSENPELSSLLRSKNAAYALGHGLTIDDTDMTYALVEELMTLPFHLIEGNKDLSQDSPEVKEFISKAEECRHLPKRGKLGDINYLSKILQTIGLAMSKPKQVRKEDGSRTRFYEIVDSLRYHETDNEGKIIRDIMLYPLLKPCLERKSEELFKKYDGEFFEKVKTDFVGEVEIEPGTALNIEEGLIETDETEALLNNRAGNKLQTPTVRSFKEKRTPTVSLAASRQEHTLADRGNAKPTEYDKPEDKVIRTSYKKGNKVWRPGRVIRYVSAEGEKLTAKYLGKAIGLINVWLRDTNSGKEFQVNPEYCI